MWQSFWAYQTDLPPGSGFAQFSAIHLAWIFTALFFIFATLVYYRRQTAVLRRRIERTLAVLLAASYLLRWTWAVLIGHYYAAEMLPLQLCALAAAMEVAAVLSRKPLLKEFGYACGIPGALVAFIMPGIGPYPLWHFYYLLFIMDHSILLLLPVLWIWGDGFRPDGRRLLRCFAILLVMAGIDVVINARIGSNFMFLNFVPADTSLKPIADGFGNPGYQFAMGLLLLIVWGILYTPWIIVNRRIGRNDAGGVKPSVKRHNNQLKTHNKAGS